MLAGLALPERLFICAALLAPLSQALRRDAVHLLWCDSAAAWRKSRMSSTWKALVWPRYLVDPTPRRFASACRALRVQLLGADRIGQEHAAYVTWLLYALPHLGQEAERGLLRELGLLVLKRALETRDHFFRRFAILIWEVEDPSLLGRCLGQLGDLRHLAFSGRFMAGGTVADQALGFLEQSMDTICGLTAPPAGLGVSDLLRHTWDLASGVAARQDHADLVAASAFRAGRDSLLTMAIARSARTPGAATDRFIVGARDRPAEGLTTQQALTKTLLNRSDRPLAVLRRRLAAFLLREQPEATRLELARVVLAQERHPFVSLSLVSSLKDTACTSGFPLLRTLLEQALRASRRSPALLHVTFDALVTLDPVQSEPICREVAANSSCHRIRGEAVHCLGRLAQHRQPGQNTVDLLCQLLAMVPHREFALNIAKVVLTAFSTPDFSPMSVAQAFDRRSRFRSPT